MTETERPAVVLIVERDENVRQLQRYFLERASFGVTFCSDGAEALNSTRLMEPALVVTEILIPKIDGLTLCRHLRSDARTRHIPVVVFSILAAAARAADAGASAFLRKPFVEAAFLATVREAIAAQSPGPMEHQWASM
jgi:CheY-like chemotaxis protein